MTPLHPVRRPLQLPCLLVDRSHRSGGQNHCDHHPESHRQGLRQAGVRHRAVLRVWCLLLREVLVVLLPQGGRWRQGQMRVLQAQRVRAAVLVGRCSAREQLRRWQTKT